MDKGEKLPSLIQQQLLQLDRSEITDPGAIAAAEAVRARFKSMYTSAILRPRNIDQARDSILRACRTTEFAEKVEFSKPVGGREVRGPSVRFAEQAIHDWGNIATDMTVVYEDANVRRIKFFATDLEANVTHSKEIVVQKSVERRKVTEDREIIGERTNTKGIKVYIVRTTEDEMQNKEAALISKALRNEGLRLIPSRIVDEAIKISRETLKSRDAQDPDASKKQMLDAFSDIGVRPNDIVAFLGHPLEQLVPAELQTLRAMYRAIKDGEATWREYMDKEEEPKVEVEVDPALIAKFDRETTEQKIDQEQLQAFMLEVASLQPAGQMTVDQVKAEALKQFPQFLAQFAKWVKSHPKKPAETKPPEGAKS